MQSTYSQQVSGSSLAETKGRISMLYQSRLEERKSESVDGARRAVVVGGSIGGMMAARVLADHYDEVILVERDHMPPGVEHRPGCRRPAISTSS